MDIAFLPNVQESIMDELRTTEGMIFRDEGAKKLFLDMKYFVFETLYSMYKSMDEQHYQTYLDNLIEWDDEKLIRDLVNRASTIKDISERLTVVTVLYAKYLYATSHPDKSVSIKKPKLEYLIRGMITRLSKMHHIRNGSFYQLDPLKQDFVFRDTFRQSLGNDCIEVSSPVSSPVTSPVTSHYKNEELMESVKDTGDDNKTLIQEKEHSCRETLKQENSEYKTELEENNLNNDNKTVVKEFSDKKTVVKEDNKTVLHELTDKKTVLKEDFKDNRTVLKEEFKENRTVLKEDNKTVLREDKTDVKELSTDKKTNDLKTVIESKTVVREKNMTLQSLEEISRKDPNEVYPDDSISQVMGRMGAASVAHSHVSRSSQFKMPTIRRVKLEDESN